jgi:hypothetical protein
MSKASNAERIPHSWSVEDWPTTVYPHRPSRGRYIVRAHRDELTTCGALTRIGRDLVVLGAGYAAWLQKQSSRVANFDIAPNRGK